MRIYYLLLCVFLSTMLMSAQDFEVIKLQSQAWVAGTAQSGRGVDYELTLVCKKRLCRLEFKELWVKDEPLKAVISEDLSNKKRFLKNDTIKVFAKKIVKTDEYGDPIEEAKIDRQPPVKFGSGALLTYKRRRRNKHILITKITDNKKIFYP